MNWTQYLINKARANERQPSSLGIKSDWSQYADLAGVEVAVFTNSIVDDKARKQGRVTKYETTKINFYIGIERISRAQAEAVLKILDNGNAS